MGGKRLGASVRKRRARRQRLRRRHESRRLGNRTSIGVIAIDRNNRGKQNVFARSVVRHPKQTSKHIAGILRTGSLNAGNLAKTSPFQMLARPGNRRRRGGDAHEAHRIDIRSSLGVKRYAIAAKQPRKPLFEALISIGNQVIPRRLVKAKPAEEAPAVAKQTGREIGGKRCGLGNEEAISANRIKQSPPSGALSAPRHRSQNRGGMSTAKRSIGAIALVKIEAPVKRFARKIHRNGRARITNADIDDHIGILSVDIGTNAAALSYTIAQRILDLKRRELRIAQFCIGAMRTNGDARARRDNLLPLDSTRSRIQKIGIPRIHATDHQHHAGGKARPQAYAQGTLGAAIKGNAAAKRTYATHAQGFQLIGQKLLHPRQAAGKVLVLGHLDFIRHSRLQ